MNDLLPRRLRPWFYGAAVIAAGLMGWGAYLLLGNIKVVAQGKKADEFFLGGQLLIAGAFLAVILFLAAAFQAIARAAGTPPLEVHCFGWAGAILGTVAGCAVAELIDGRPAGPRAPGPLVAAGGAAGARTR